jgi:phosphoglycerate dehydrogenase-like enzyme
MTVLAWSPNLTQDRAQPYGVRAVAKTELFAAADVISIHMPLSSLKERSMSSVSA